MSPSRHVLIVDDDTIVAEACALSLRRAGFRVTTAAHFGPALAVLESSDCPDLLLTDIVMPGSVNGIALARMGRMRRRDLRVIYMTGYDIPGAEEQASGTILRKPVDSDNLVQIVEETFAKPAV
jgi:DNA-binding NtrC family response regulator